jgi:hypothetical protein
MSSPDRRDAGLEVLRRFTRPRAPVERCDLCAREIGVEHEHLIDPAERRLACACGPCAVLFSGRAGTRLKRVPREVRLPIDLAFFYESTPQSRVVACYPSPAGATESLLELDTWSEIRAAHPALLQLEPDVQALLVNRVRRGGGRNGCFLVPIDQCFRLVGIIRMHWKGFTGGPEVWDRIDRFFTDLRSRTRPDRVSVDA